MFHKGGTTSAVDRQASPVSEHSWKRKQSANADTRSQPRESFLDIVSLRFLIALQNFTCHFCVCNLTILICYTSNTEIIPFDLPIRASVDIKSPRMNGSDSLFLIELWKNKKQESDARLWAPQTTKWPLEEMKWLETCIMKPHPVCTGTSHWFICTHWCRNTFDTFVGR